MDHRALGLPALGLVLLASAGCGEPRPEVPYKEEAYRSKIDPNATDDPAEAERRRQQMEVMEKYGKASEQIYGKKGGGP
jgi:hypothetical protein